MKTNKQTTITKPAKSSKKSQTKFKIQAEPWNTSNSLESELKQKNTYPNAWNLEWRAYFYFPRVTSLAGESYCIIVLAVTSYTAVLAVSWS